MTEEINEWKHLYQQQETSMTTITLELTRVRGRDRRRYLTEGLALLTVVGAGIYYLTLGTLTAVFAGTGLLLFAAASAGYAFLRVRGIAEASFAAPKDYVCELEARNAREIRRLSPTWYLYAVAALCVGVNTVALLEKWDAYVAAPWVMVSAVVVQGLILGGVILWRRQELRRLRAEHSAIADLRSQMA